MGIRGIYIFLIRHFKPVGLPALLWLLLSNIAVAQDATFSQYYASSLYLNPAFAGMESKVTFSTNYRTQWKSIVKPYTTGQVSVILPIKMKKYDRHLGGIGISVYNNVAGDGNLQTTGINLNLGYNVHFSELHRLSFGLQGGVVQKSINIDRLQWGTQFNPLVGGFDPSIPMNTSDFSKKTLYTDFAGGIMYSFNPERDYEEKGFSFFAGAAGYHLSQPNESMVKGLTSKIPFLIKSFAGIEFELSQKFLFSPNVFIANQDKRSQINTGAYLTFLFGESSSAMAPSRFLLGGWYRMKDSYIFTVGLGSGNYTLGFSYDLNNSLLRYYTQGKGAYEISLRVTLGSNKKVKIYNPLI